MKAFFKKIDPRNKKWLLGCFIIHINIALRNLSI